MNTEKFSEAQVQYNAGDYRKSARLFLDAVEKGTPIGNGPAYHMAGNSFMRLKRYSDATVVFEHALRDDTYQRRGAVEANLANAYIRTGDYDSAIAHYEAALALEDAEDTYKLYLGTAQAYMRQQKFELAAVAYKHAALDPDNPAPGKSLLNLGLAMMANGNAKSAIEAYQAALSSPEYENKGRALLNMGVAYHSLGMWEDAIAALEEAKLQDNYQESELARGTLADAKHRLDLEAQVAEADLDIDSAEDEDTVDPVEAYMAEAAAPVTVADAEEDLAGTGEMDAVDSQWTEEVGPDATWADDSEDDVHMQRETRVGNAEDVERFFTMSEEEATEQSRDFMMKERGRFFWVKWVLLIVLLLGGIGGGGAALYFTGQGFPSAETTVTDLLESYSRGNSIAEYWTFEAQGNIESRMIIVPIPESFTIDAVDLGASQSSVRASVTTAGEETLTFSFVLVREGIGWKVNEVIADGVVEAGDSGAPDDDSEDADSDDDFEFDEEDWDFSEYDFDLGEEAPE